MRLLQLPFGRPWRLALWLGMSALALPSSAQPAPQSRGLSPLAVRASLAYAPPPTVAWAPPRTRSRTPSRSLARRSAADPWLSFDKVQHVTFSFLWTLGSQYALVNKAEWSEGAALPASASTAAFIGLAKEVYDWRIAPSRFFSRRDLVADAVGVALGIGFIAL